MSNLEVDGHLNPTDEISLETVKKKAARGILLLTSRTFILQIVSLLATFLLTIYLNPAEFGTFFLISAVINFFAYFSDVGLAPALIQKKEIPTSDDLKTTFTIQQCLVLALVLLILAITPTLQSFYKINQTSVYLIWALSFSLVLSSLKTIPSVILERKLDFQRLIIPQLFESLIFNLSAVYFAWRGFGINSFTIAIILRSTAGFILMYVIQPWKPGLAFSKESLRNLFKYGLPYQGNTFLAVIKDDGMTAFLGGILGPSGIGLLGWAQKWGSAPLRFFMDQVIKVTFPAFSRMQDDRVQLSRAVSKSIFFITLVVFPTLMLLVILSPLLTEVIPKYEKWQPALLALGFIAVNSAWAAVTTPLTNLLNAVGRITLSFKLMIMWTILTWVLVPILSINYGVTGAGLAFGLIGFSSIIAIRSAAKYIDINFWEVVGKTLISSLGMGLGLIFIENFVSRNFMGVATLTVCALLIYAFLIFALTGKTILKDVRKALSLFIIAIVSSIWLILPPTTLAKTDNTKSFVTIVNPIRGEDFWEIKDQTSVTALTGQLEILQKNSLNATWLIRFDAFKNNQLVETAKKIDQSDELGIFLEVTPSWTGFAGVTYHPSPSWHSAASALLTGYSPSDRIKLIDTAFNNFKQIFGVYPKSVGAWYIDSFSLDYMQKKYKVGSALIVADQYTTDGYQIWGQYWAMPYYPSSQNTLIPAQNINSKIPIVVMQWAARDPINGYGNGVQESTYSVQANDYLDFHDLDINYFSKLVDTYTKQDQNQVNQIVVGLENSYSWKKYQAEYRKQIETLAKKQNEGSLKVVNMAEFSQVYFQKFPQVSPSQLIFASDPLGSEQKVVWYMNPYYRAGWFYDLHSSVFRDIRQYNIGDKEPCFDRVCNEINFATFSTRVLDDVTYQKKLVLDKGRITDINAKLASADEFRLTYKNEADIVKEINFLKRDIEIDGQIKSIDTVILDALQQQVAVEKQSVLENNPQLFKKYQLTFTPLLINTLKFLGFVILGLFIPGFLILSKSKDWSFLTKLFLSISLGFSTLTMMAFMFRQVYLDFLIPLSLGLFVIIFFYFKKYQDIISVSRVKPSLFGLMLLFLILLGTIFQVYGVAKSGQVYEYGIGFWGPTAHDLVWHQALINQLVLKIPPDNPILSHVSLGNYHYFYDLLVAQTYHLTQIPIDQLIYRYFPILFSVLLGVGVYQFVDKISHNKVASLLAIFFTYFGSSFGFIPTFLKSKTIWGGESAFWANQPVSFNLNPPFAISILLFLAGLILFFEFSRRKNQSPGVIIPLILIWGSLIEFKVYAGIIVLSALGLITAIQFLQKNFTILKVTIPIFILSLIIFLPQNLNAPSLLVINPFWFVHTMIDFEDRVGWSKLSSARSAYFGRNDWFKIFLAEGLGLAIFLIGNLGTRSAAILKINSLFKIKNLRDPFNQFLIFSSSISVIIVLIFIQVGTPWNIIQFLYYFLFLFSIFAGLGLANLLKNGPKKISFYMAILLILITPISSISTFLGYSVKQAHAIIPISELDGLNFLKNQPPGVILTYPFEKETKTLFEEPFPLLAYDTTSYVSAYSGKISFIEDEVQQEIFQSDYKKRLVKSYEFFKTSDTNWATNFLKSEKISYIYLPKLLEISLNIQDLELEKIFENNNVSIFKTKQ